eukprot:TRINITY_DN27691_c0_g1_i5.p1 TRINITY_DN27691_c0_g1~~TRINITY_DN27691_c0_g1_i5.p1  ORF type:complete len:491 (+),score=124.32 TRINITY_DN27691_c0_g1_i5:282-1754(+)
MVIESITRNLVFPARSVVDPFITGSEFKQLTKEEQLQFIVDSVDLSRKLAFDRVCSLNCRHLKLESEWIVSEMGHMIPVVRVLNSQTNSGRLTVIYSHANAEELSKTCINEMAQFAVEADVDLILYEYAGYSFTQDSDGKFLHDQVCESSCIASLAAVFDYSTRERTEHQPGLGLKASEIVLYGRSLGTGITLDLAHRLKEPVAALLLFSPFMSICSTVMSAAALEVCCCFKSNDLLASVQKVATVKAKRIFIVHGTSDDVVPFSNCVGLTKALEEAGKNVVLMAIPGAKHNNLAPVYLQKFGKSLHDEVRQALHNIEGYTWQELDMGPRTGPTTKPAVGTCTAFVLCTLLPLAVPVLVLISAMPLYTISLVITGPWAEDIRAHNRNVWVSTDEPGSDFDHDEPVEYPGDSSLSDGLSLVFCASLLVPIVGVVLAVLKLVSKYWTLLNALCKSKYEERKRLYAARDQAVSEYQQAYSTCLLYTSPSPRDS